MGPLASAVARDDRAAIAPLYGFATRVSVAISLPLAASLIGGRHTWLRMFDGAYAAGAMVTVLTLGRIVEAVGGQANAIQQVASPRLKPLVSAFTALAVAALAATFLLPRFGATGLAASVSLGIGTMTLVSLLQLWRDLGLHPFSSPFPRVAATALVVAGSLLLGLPFLEPLPPVGEVTALLAALLAGIWVTAKVGLGPADKDVLGSVAVRMRL
jgi:hypothetical protein